MKDYINLHCELQLQTDHSDTSAATSDASSEYSVYQSDTTHDKNHSRTLTSSDIDSKIVYHQKEESAPQAKI